MEKNTKIRYWKLCNKMVSLFKWRWTEFILSSFTYGKVAINCRYRALANNFKWLNTHFKYLYTATGMCIHFVKVRHDWPLEYLHIVQPKILVYSHRFYCFGYAVEVPSFANLKTQISEEENNMVREFTVSL